MKNKIFFICFLLVSCTHEDSFLVRFWNGDILPSFTNEEKKIIEQCDKYLRHMPHSSTEDIVKYNEESSRCYIKNKKNNM